MADGQREPELLEERLPSEFFKIILELFSMNDRILEGRLTKDHLIGGEGAGLIGEDAVDDSQFLYDGGVQDSALFFYGGIVEFPIEGEEEAREGLDALDDDVERDGDEKVEHEEDGKENERGCMWEGVH